MLYSVRMRAAEGTSHEAGGRHISGAERLIRRERIAPTLEDMLDRALSHSRGRADYINFTVEAVGQEKVCKAPLLPVKAIKKENVESARSAARKLLEECGVSAQAAKLGIMHLSNLKDSMRGAMIVCAQTGVRLDSGGTRGVRVSRMDIDNEAQFEGWLERNDLQNIHVREAMVLAAKVASAPGAIAELCWSDDPEYTTGYVASARGYTRITNLKPYGSLQGGRIFFASAHCDIAKYCEYLERQSVLITVGEEVQ